MAVHAGGVSVVAIVAHTPSGRLRWRCAHAGAAPQSCSIRSISSHTPLIADNNSESMLT